MGETCLGELRSVSKDFICESIDTTSESNGEVTFRGELLLTASI